MEIPFDNNTGEKYTLDVDEENIETGDGVVLVLNKKACVAFAKLFTTLAETDGCSHLHLGYDHDCPMGPGFRIEVNDDI
jgi:hypothetical protein